MTIHLERYNEIKMVISILFLHERTYTDLVIQVMLSVFEGNHLL